MNQSNRPTNDGEPSSASQSNGQTTTAEILNSDIQQWEVEQKYHLRDPAGLIAKLAELDFEQVGVEQHHDTYWQHPARDFRQSDEAFRIRRVNDTACMTYKGPRAATATAQPDAKDDRTGNENEGEIVPAKTREEIELSIDAEQYPQWLRMLSRLGFQAQPAVVKRRLLHSSSLAVWDGMLVAVDDVEQLGKFVEIELLVRSAEQLSSARVRIASLARQLGLTDAQPLELFVLVAPVARALN